MKVRIKAQVRLELFRCAAVGSFPSYEQFRSLMMRQRRPGRFQYQGHFNKIAEEEIQLGYPDITLIVRSKDADNPYPRQIKGKSALPKPTAEQLEYLRNGIDQIIEFYCPEGTVNPYR